MTSTYNWHESYRAALLETEWTKMRQRIQVAESTINQRQERKAIDAAIHDLKVLRKETPEWLDRRGTTNSYWIDFLVKRSVAAPQLCLN
jgi:hypothetical protein